MSQAEKNKKKIFDSRYEVIEIVGRGGSSVVYRAKHILADNKEVALKVLTERNGVKLNSDVLRRESLAMITARHKYVIRLEDFRSVDSICYLAMEYAPQSDLKAYTKKHGGRLNPLAAERYLRQITEALAFIHGIGMVHRDIKPENILVINDRQVRLSDFGVAILPGQTTSMEELQKGIGTINYMAPESLEGKECGPFSDVYSLALTFYELLSGKNPFVGGSLAETLEAKKGSATPLAELNKDIPKNISEAISKALEYDSSKRFKNAEEFLNRLNEPVIDGKITQPKENEEASTIHTGVTEEAFVAKSKTSETKQEVPEPKPETPDTPESKDITVEENLKQNEPAPTSSEPQTPAPQETGEDHFFQEEQEPEEVITYEEPTEEATESVSDETSKTTLEEFNYESNYEPHKRPAFSNILFVGMILCTCYLAYRLFIAPIFTTEPVQTTETSALNIPEGIYSGHITGFEVEQNTPLSLMSMGEEQDLVFLVGMPGWLPIPVGKSELHEEFQVKSNGNIFILKALQSDDVLKGEYVNLTTETKGTWEISLNSQS